MTYPIPEMPAPSALRCPKCGGTMRTYERNGVHLEQCDTCRGIFLDFGELEALSQLEARIAHHQAAPTYQQAPPPYQQAPPPGYGPGWSQQSGYSHRRSGFGRLFFSS